MNIVVSSLGRIAKSLAVALLLISSASFLVPSVRAQGSWVSMANTPYPVNFGACLAWTGGDYIYALFGRNTQHFFRYSISGNSWTRMPPIPYPIGSGGSLVWTGGDYLYALTGGGPPYFFRYIISSNSWQQMPSIGPSVNDGGSLVWTGGDYLYAFIGGNTGYFFSFNMLAYSWTQLPNTPFPQQTGADMVWTGGDYLYASRGGGTPPFFRYSISGGSWASMLNCPYPIGPGGSLVWTGGDYLYALVGNGNPRFYRYSVSIDSWTQMPDVGLPVAYGGCLEKANGYIYAFAGGDQLHFRRYRHADVAVSGVAFTKTMVCQGCSTFINATVENQGGFTEIFNVTGYADLDTAVIGDEITIGTDVVTLTCGDSENVPFTWNTTGVAKGNYTISVYAVPVLDETETVDNMFTDGWVIVSMVGDVTGPDGWPDGKCDIRDVALVALYFGQSVPPAPPNCDITGPTLGVPDGIVDIRDIATVALHFGEVDP